MKNFNPEFTVKKIREEMVNYLKDSRLQSLVVGQSGGIDSALVVALVAPVCKMLKIQLFSRYIHIETNAQDEADRAKAMDFFVADYQSVDLTDLYFKVKAGVNETRGEDAQAFAYRVRMGNIKARLRMIYLYNLAQQHRGMVLSTDNYTELMLGFWTLHGDVGDYAPIGYLWKTEVYACAKWLVDNELQSPQAKTALQRAIDAVPTDGLGTTHSDLDQLQAPSYAEVDALLRAYVEEGKRDEKLLQHPVIQRHISSAYKRNNPYYIPRERVV